MTDQETLIREIGIAAAVTQTELSAPAILAMVEDLSVYPVDRAIAAIRRARREVNRLTLAAILERLERSDGHPGADEAWALCPMSEADTAVWTDQMAEAFGIASRLLPGDPVGARMAFRAAYERLVEHAREKAIQPRWWATLGTDPAKRETAIRDAVAKGRLTVERARALLPAPQTSAGGEATLQIAMDDTALRQRWRDLLQRMKQGKVDA